jgi:hypothetical protein
VAQSHIGCDVGGCVVPDQWLGYLEVGERDLDPVGDAIVDRPHHRVALAQEQPSARAQQAINDLGPATDVGEPAQRPDPGVRQVELAGREHVERAIEVGFDELDVRARRGRQSPGFVDGGGGEVQAGHPRAQAGQRDRVRADVTLQMDAALAVDVPEPGQVEPDYRAEEARVGQETHDRVVG